MRVKVKYEKWNFSKFSLVAEYASVKDMTSSDKIENRHYVKEHPIETRSDQRNLKGEKIYDRTA